MSNHRLNDQLTAAVCAAALLIAGPAIAAFTPSPPSQAPARPPSEKPTQPGAATDAAARKTSAAKSDVAFVARAAEGGMMEIAKGKLAAQKAAHEGVKQFGQQMVDDHTKAGDELKALATTKNIPLPGDTPKPPMQAALAKLEKLEGAAFDRAYVDDQIRDHEKTIALFERQAKSGSDAELKSFAEKTLPTLKTHLSTVRDLKTKVTQKGTD